MGKPQRRFGKEFEATGMSAAPAALLRLLCRLGFTYKESADAVGMPTVISTNPSASSKMMDQSPGGGGFRNSPAV